MRRPNQRMVEHQKSIASDPRSSEQLLTELRSCQNDDDWWNIIIILHARQDESIIRKGLEMCHADDPDLRSTGAILIAQNPDCVAVQFAKECKNTLLTMLKSEQDEEVLGDVILSSKHCIDRRNIRDIVKYKTHPSAYIRYCVVQTLDDRKEPEAISTLIELSADSDVKVRSWSAFFLGRNNVDTAEIPDALRARLLDEDAETRSEALAGLAMIGDDEVIPYILHELELYIVNDSYWESTIDAVNEMRWPGFQPHLVYMYDVGYDYEVITDAIEACTAPTQKGCVEWDGEWTSCPVCGLQHAFSLRGRKQVCSRCDWHFSKVQVKFPRKRYIQNRASLIQSRNRWLRWCQRGEDPVTAQTRLCSSPNELDRKIATCYFGWTDDDSFDIREALSSRLSDTCDEVRCCALYALAQRGDERIIPYINKELANPPSDEGDLSLLLYAVAELPKIEFLPQLLSLRDLGNTSEELDAAIEACTVVAG